MPLRSIHYKDKDKLLVTRNAQRKRYYRQTQSYERRSWTEWEEVEVLKQAISDMELSKVIKRSVGAIQEHRCRLIKNIKEVSI